MQSNIKLGYSLRSLHNTSRSGRRQSVVMAEVHNKTVMLLLSFAQLHKPTPLYSQFFVLLAGRDCCSWARPLFSSYSN